LREGITAVEKNTPAIFSHLSLTPKNEQHDMKFAAGMFSFLFYGLNFRKRLLEVKKYGMLNWYREGVKECRNETRYFIQNMYSG
jgi:hypothetical protein